MKTFITGIVASFTIVLTFTACFPDGSRHSPAADVIPTHVIVALDLSDRIHNQETASRDILVIEQLFSEFLAKCREEMFVDCKGSFNVTLVPQRGDRSLNSLLDSLSIDLARIDDMQKRKAVEQFASLLGERVRRLYAQARKPSLADYDGACVWRFMNNRLPAFLDAHKDGGRTQLYLLSDGLVEVDSPQARVEAEGRRNFIPDSMMNELRSHNAWRNSDRLAGLLLLPENLMGRTDSIDFSLIGLQGRSDYALEADLISAIWDAWMKQIPTVAHFMIIGYDTEMSIVKAKLNNLNNY